MGTRSHIGLAKNGQVEYVYCHWDGYPSYNGVLLNTHYTEEKKIQELLNMCDLSSLGANPISGEDWAKLSELEQSAKLDDGALKYPLSYNNWRNEGTKSHTVTLGEYLTIDEQSWIEYKYLFIDWRWICFDSEMCVHEIKED
jgi:hypothetical protein